MEDRSKTLEEQVEALKHERDYFRLALAYLASCNAATIESLPLKYPKSKRQRFKDINRRAIDLIEGRDSIATYCFSGSDESYVAGCVNRCKKVQAAD